MLALLIAILVGIVAAVVMHSQEAFSDKENPEMNRGIVSVITSVIAYILLAFSVGIGGTADDEVELANNADRNEAVSETEDGERGTSQRPSEKRKEDEAEDEEDGSLLGNIFKKKDKEKAESDNEDEGLIASIFGNDKKKEDKESDSPKWVYDNTSNQDNEKESDEVDDVVITPIFPGDKPGFGDDLLANNDNTNKEENEKDEKEEEKVEEDKGGSEEKPSTPEKPSKPEDKPAPEKPSKPEKPAPERPSKPEEKPTPEKPSKPEETPSKPAPEKPSKPEEKPSKPETPEKPGTETPGEDKPETPEKPGHSVKPPIIKVVKDLVAVEGTEKLDITEYFEFIAEGDFGYEIITEEIDLSTPGTYTVYITVTDTYGNITSEAHPFRVEAKPVVEEPSWPEKPEETPEKPEETPEKPGEEKPEETPGGDKPETPEKPGDDKPGTETPETPEKPGDDKPGTETPEKPEETPGGDKPETPEKPGDDKPGAETPEKPEETPGGDKPGTEKPEEEPDKVEKEYEFVEITHEFEEIVKNDPNMFHDEVKVISEGKLGHTTKMITHRYVNGKLINSTEEILSHEDPVDRIVIQGTKSYSIDDIPTVNTGDEELDKAIYKINKHRVLNNVRPIAESGIKINEVASIRAKETYDMYQELGKLTHDRPNGESLADLMREVDYVPKSYNVNENLGYADTWGDAIESWIASPGHNRNLLAKKSSEVGLAKYGEIYVFISS